jgi:membrane protease YdiL (CAAX protease family)
MAEAAKSWSRAGLVLTLYLALAAAGVAWSSLRGDGSVWRVAGREDAQVLLGIVAGALLGLGFVFASRLAVHRFEWARALHRDMRALLGPLPDAEVVVLAVASSLGEEIFFRGALLPVVGLTVSSFVFALLHVGPKLRYLPWTLSSLVAGLVFGQLFLWSGDLTGPVVAHFTVNFLNLRYLSAHEMR